MTPDHFRRVLLYDNESGLISIMPWWGWILLVLGIGLLVFGFLRWRTLNLRKQKLLLEETVRERTRELEEQRDRAALSEKFKEQFLANMSHEIRTPMHAITGMANILMRSELMPHQEKYLKAIQRSSTSLMVILNDILDLSRIEVGKIEVVREPTSIRDVVENVIGVLELKAREKGLDLRHRIQKEVPRQMIGDPTRLTQILLNLLGNAIKFTDSGYVDLEVVVTGDDLEMRISDTGIGIREEKIETIFKPFEQAESNIIHNYGGTGLGLTITRELIRLQQGRVTVESEVGRGSTFRVFLPLETVSDEPSSAPGRSDEELRKLAADTGRFNILLVEDNDFNVMITTDDMAFFFPEAELTVSRNGKSGLEAFGKGEYDLILMDIQMPEMNGYEATEAIRKMEARNGVGTRTTIVAMTASLLSEEIEKCYDAGMDDYLPKPYKPEEFVAVIRRGLKRNRPAGERAGD